MQNAEMKLVRMDSTDVIATSGPGGDWLQLANLGDENPGNETLTGSFMGKSLNFTNNGKQGDIPTRPFPTTPHFTNPLEYCRIVIKLRGGRCDVGRKL